MYMVTLRRRELLRAEVLAEWVFERVDHTRLRGWTTPWQEGRRLIRMRERCVEWYRTVKVILNRF